MRPSHSPFSRLRPAFAKATAGRQGFAGQAILNSPFRQSGQALVELLVAFALFGLFSVAVTTLSVDALWTIQTGPEYTAASAYAQEGLEASRQIADRSWTALTLGDHGITVETIGNETRYAFAANSDTRGIHSRVVRVSEVQRDAAGNIVERDGTIDPDTRRVTSTVSWQTGATRRQSQAVLTTILTNWESFSWTETLETEFRQGTLASTEVLAVPPPPIGNGSVRLQGAVDWSAPVIRGTFDADGSGDARAVVVGNGYAYLVMDDGGDGRLLVVDISDVTAPTLAGSVTLGAPGRALAMSGGYAYVARSTPTGELAVIDARIPTAPTLVRTLDPAGAAAGQSVAVEGTTLLLGRAGSGSADELIAYTLPSADPSNPIESGTLNLPGDPSVPSVVLRSGTAVLGTSADDAEVTIVNAGNLPNLSVLGTLDLPGNADATGVAVSGQRAYVTRGGGNEFAVVDIATPGSPSVLGELDLGNGANGLAVEGGFAYVAARSQGNEFQRVDAGTPGSLSVAGSAAVGAEPLGVFFSGSYAFLATAGNDRELVIIGGGEGGWANPTHVGSVDLGGGKPLLAVAAAGDYAYAGREKAEGNGEFVIFDVREPRTPTLLGQLEVNDSVHDVAVLGHRAFLATDANAKELIIVDVANPGSPVELGSYNAPGNSDGLGVAVLGNTVALATRANASGPEVHLLDTSDPTAPALRGSIDIPDNHDVNAVVASSTHLFLATSDTTRDVQIYDITNLAAPTFSGSFDTVGSGNAISLVLRATELHVGTRNNGGGDPEFFILNVSDPSNPQLVSPGSALNIGGDILGLDVSGTVGFVGSNREDEEFQTLNLATLTSPAVLGKKEFDATVNDIVVAGTYAYLATAKADEGDIEGEFHIFKSADAGGFATTGTYDSIAFDSGSPNAVWEGLSWNAVLNSGTVQFQIRRGDTQAALESALFAGPDGTVNTFYDTSPSVLALPKSTDPLPGQWIQWRALFNGTQVATPELQDVTLTFRQ